MYLPPVFSARQAICLPSSAVRPKPTTSAVKSTPVFFSSLPSAHGSPPQVSRPSVMRTTVALSSVYFSASAACLTAAVSGVLPRNFMLSAAAEIALAEPACGGTISSMSSQLPLVRWP